MCAFFYNIIYTGQSKRENKTLPANRVHNAEKRAKICKNKTTTNQQETSNRSGKHWGKKLLFLLWFRLAPIFIHTIAVGHLHRNMKEETLPIQSVSQSELEPEPTWLWMSYSNYTWLLFAPTLTIREHGLCLHILQQLAAISARF